MVFSRRKSYSRSGVKRPYKRGRSSYAAASKSFGKQLTRVKNRAIANLRTGGLVGIETKFLDMARTQYSVFSVAANGGGLLPGNIAAVNGVQPLKLPGGTAFSAPQALCACLSAPAIGSTANSRDGRQIRAVDITVVGTVSVGGGALHDAQHNRPPNVHIALVMDLQTNASAQGIAATEVFDYPAGKNLATEYDAEFGAGQVFRNIENLPRYRVLAYKTIVLPYSAFVVDANDHCGGALKNFRMSRRLQFPIQFLKDSVDVAGGAFTRASVSDRSICVLAWTSHHPGVYIAPPDVSSDATVGLTYSSRFRWVG